MNAATPAVTDFAQFSKLRAAAENNDPAVLREVASQFEALFVQTMMKNMRAGQLAESIFSSDQHEMYTEMLDQQLAVEMTRGRGLGLADMLVSQLGGEVGGASAQPAPPAGEPVSIPVPPVTGRGMAPTAAISEAGTATGAAADQRPDGWSTPAEFAADIWPHVQRVARALNVAPEGVLAQAALETGWGQHVMPRSDGSSSHNLFGIKAGGDWFGGSVVRKTIEFADGVAQQVNARFRAYEGLKETFDDYARFIQESPRYSGVVESGSNPADFAEALQSAGYATDPQYAEKIRRIAVGETLRDALSALKNLSATPIPLPQATNTVR